MSGGSATIGPPPGTVDPFTLNDLANRTQNAMTGMTNRYAQLGLSSVGATPNSPGGAAGGIGVGNIGQQLNFPQASGLASAVQGGGGDFAGLGGGGFPGTSSTGGINVDQSQMPTAEQMDLGMIPSLVGGIPEMALATFGQLENLNLTQPQPASAVSGGGGKGGGGLGSIAGLAGGKI